MHQVTTAFSNHLQGQVTTLATCWKVIRKDGQVFGFTDFDADIYFPPIPDPTAQLFSKESGYTRSAIASSTDLSIDDLEVDGFIDSTIITDPDLRAGIWNSAYVEVFMVNWMDLTMGRLKLRRGWLGQVTLKEFGFMAELRGLMKALSQAYIELYSPECRATLGDARCKFDITSTQQTGAVALVDSIDPIHKFATAGVTAVADFFTYGVVEWLTGLNAGYSMDIKQWDATNVIMFLGMPYDVAVGDTFRLTQGCDHKPTTCRNTFNNLVNFRGEPFVPGNDKALTYPDAHA